MSTKKEDCLEDEDYKKEIEPIKERGIIGDIIYIDSYRESCLKTRVRLGNQIDALKKRKIPITETLQRTYDLSVASEDSAKKLVDEVVKHHPLYICFFQHIRGIGGGLGGSLIALYKDVSRYNTLTKFLAYGGLCGDHVEAECSEGHKLIMASDKTKICPVLKDFEGNKCEAALGNYKYITGKAPRPKKGYMFMFNARIKKVAYKMSVSIIRQDKKVDESRRYFSDIYYTEKERLTNETDLANWLIDKRARRKMIVFIFSLMYEAWSKLEGIEPRPPYCVEKQGHSWIRWAEVQQKLEALEKQAKENAKKLKSEKKDKKKEVKPKKKAA